MQEYKRLWQRAEAHSISVQEKESSSKRILTSVSKYLNSLFETISHTAKRLELVDAQDVKTVFGENSRMRILNTLLESDISQADTGLSDQVRQINDILAIINTRVYAVANSKFSTVDEAQSELIRTFKKQDLLIDELQIKCENLTAEHVSLKLNFESQKQKLEEKVQESEVALNQLKATEKKLDRIKFAQKPKDNPVATIVEPVPTAEEARIHIEEPSIFAEQRQK
ncbi:hypothetical protein HK096_001346, partial [Nowakowskiella sp. JEL0078]